MVPEFREADEAIAFFAPRVPRSPDRKLIAQCAEEVAAYRRQRPPADVGEIEWLLESENRAVADFVRWQTETAVTERDQMLIAQTALVICMAYERSLTKREGIQVDRPSDSHVTVNVPALTSDTELR